MEPPTYIYLKQSEKNFLENFIERNLIYITLGVIGFATSAAMEF
jgi:hypothetical protein